MYNIILAGVGGQGTVLASKLIARCAMEQGQMVRTAETIGMAQRGGSVVSHVRVGDDCYAPLVPEGCADVVIGFEPGEAVRALGFLKPGGTVVINTAPVKPVTDSLAKTSYSGVQMLDYVRSCGLRIIVVDGAEIIHQCGSAKALNIAMLGAAAAAGVIGCTPEQLQQVVELSFPARFRESNRLALSMGAAAVG